MSEQKTMNARVIHVSEMAGHPGAIYIGRAVPRKGFKASKWGNPFSTAIHERDRAIDLYRDWLTTSDEGRDVLRDLPELRGHVLACWCAPQRCHGDVLVELLNQHSDDELRAMATGGVNAHSR